MIDAIESIKLRYINRRIQNQSIFLNIWYDLTISFEF